MCLIVVAHHAHPRYPLIVAANRDEFYQRPTASARFWAEHPQLLAGKDLHQGGTWLGVTRNGRFAAVTNVRNGREAPPDAPRSRGQLPLGFLLSSATVAEHAAQLEAAAATYGGFNLLIHDGHSLAYLSNRYPGQRPLAPGIYGLSNASLNTPWPKLQRASAALKKALDRAEPDPEQLFTLLADPTPAPIAELPDTGIDSAWEALLSPCFIASEDYGTRSSTLLLRDQDGTTHFWERNFTPGLPITTDNYQLAPAT